MSEETIYNENENEALENEGIVLDEKQDAASESDTVSDDKQKRNGKTARVAGVTGMAGVVAGMLLPVNFFPDAEEIEEEKKEEKIVTEDIEKNMKEEDWEMEIAPKPQPDIVGHDMPVASGVEDSMSFNQAFAAARREVGAGGIFVWRGHAYGTYYANEWNAMSDVEHDQYWADVYHTTPKIDYDPISDPIVEQTPVLEPEPEPQVEKPVLALYEEDIHFVVDVDGDDKPEMAIVDANGNELPDVLVDENGGGEFNKLLLDPEMDDEGNIIVDEHNVIDIGGAVIIPHEVAEEPNSDGLLVSNAVEGDSITEQADMDATANDMMDAGDDLLV